MAYKRDYKQEYKSYQGKPQQIAERSSRNHARREAIKAGIITKGSSKDIDHKDRNPRNDALSNLRAQSKTENRSRNSHKSGRY